ncbi:MAG: ATP-dependent DNA helicase [Candidatus Omnitrophota bacterium]
MDINDVFKEEGLIAGHLENYEFRAQQVHMAAAVKEAIDLKKHLLIEAGTGVGKSLAYLVPFIEWSSRANQKVAISTYTKTLQEQLIKKDLPFLQAALGIDFKFALCVGGQNYICLRRLNMGYEHDLFEALESSTIERIHRWLDKTKSGLYSDLDFEPKDITWAKICRESDLCLGRKCAYRKDCFYRKARLADDNANILVLNHHLFFANLISGGRVLPDFSAVVFDEAHTLENVATEYLGIEITNFKISYFLDSILNLRSGKGFLSRIRKINNKKARGIEAAHNKVHQAAKVFFDELITRFGPESKTQRLRTRNFIPDHLKEPLLGLSSLLAEVLDDVKDDEDKVQIKSYLSRAKEISLGLEVIINQSEDGYVYWMEALNRPRRPKYSLYAAPVDISGQFRQKVLDNFKLIIFTSATLSANNDFEFTKQSLGIEDAKEMILSSPFDYYNQALVYIPQTMPDPNREFAAYQTQAITEIEKIIRIMHGRTFVLFTNYKMLDAANDALSENLKDFNIVKQGDIPRYKALEKFKTSSRSVLLGTTTFWQGVDVPGRALECVIITKLPFAVPDDPVIEARMELIRAQNKDPFIHYQVPQAIIMFRQGFGRLIRKKTDIGMVAILDPRVRTRFYGRGFLEALPECQRAYTLEGVKKFFFDFSGGVYNNQEDGGQDESRDFAPEGYALDK